MNADERRDLLDAAYAKACDDLAAAHEVEHQAVATLHAAQAVTERAAKACMATSAALLANARGDRS